MSNSTEKLGKDLIEDIEVLIYKVGRLKEDVKHYKALAKESEHTLQSLQSLQDLLGCDRNSIAKCVESMVSNEAN